MGGVRSGLDALELIAAGATSVALGTVLFADPDAPTRVRDELDVELRARGFDFARERAESRIGPMQASAPKCTRTLLTTRSTELAVLRRLVRLPRHGLAQDPGASSLRSLDQRMEALDRANDIRVKRAQLKKDLKDGHVRRSIQILRNPPEYVSTAKVFDILMAVPKFGRVKAARFLNQCRISQSKTVGGLSERQRTELVGLFNR